MSFKRDYLFLDRAIVLCRLHTFEIIHIMQENISSILQLESNTVDLRDNVILNF